MQRTLAESGRPAERLAVAVLFLLLLGGAVAARAFAETRPHASWAVAPRTVILISLDGTVPSWVNDRDLPTLDGLAARGLRALQLVPVQPTNTFPNHVTLISGVPPEVHGIVNNRFIDPVKGSFAKRDIPAWIEVEPLWSILAGEGIVSASYHWVGSEGRWPGGSGPRHWVPFDSGTREAQKVDRILAWLALADPCERPRFITTWFHGADHVAHVDGPKAPGIGPVLRGQDRALARLVEGLRERGLLASTTLLVVSDHGMRSADTRVDLGAVLARGDVDATVIGIGGFASIYLAEPSPKAVSGALAAARSQGLQAFERSKAPASLRVRNARFGHVIVRAPIGTAIVSARTKLKGFHGYPPHDDSMAGLFVAVGEGVPVGRVVERVYSVDIAPTILALLGLSVPDWMHGKPMDSLSYPDPHATNALVSARLPACETDSPASVP